jgi:hypothetical protein
MPNPPEPPVASTRSVHTSGSGSSVAALGFASISSFTNAAAVVKRALRFCWHAARHSPVASHARLQKTTLFSSEAVM